MVILLNKDLNRSNAMRKSWFGRFVSLLFKGGSGSGSNTDVKSEENHYSIYIFKKDNNWLHLFC